LNLSSLFQEPVSQSCEACRILTKFISCRFKYDVEQPVAGREDTTIFQCDVCAHPAAERPRCAAGAALWLREPTGACLLAVGTNALLGNDVERRKVDLEAQDTLTERTTTHREAASVDTTLSETL
jgi:hypothetical protein